MNKVILYIVFLAGISTQTYAQSDTIPQVNTPQIITNQEGETDSLTQGSTSHTQDSWVRWTTDSIFIDSLSGNVIFSQDSMVLYCDSAIIVNEIDVLAWGNVALVQHDTIEAFSDTLTYNALTKKSKLTGKVVLQNQDERLVTETLHYDLATKIAEYFTGAEMTQHDVSLRSDKGTYFVSRKEAIFRSNVYVVDSSFVLWTDSMRYNLRTDRANFFGPTRINQNDARLYCEKGHYDIPDQAAQLNINAQYESDSLVASADQLFYDGLQEEIVLQGNAKFKNHTSFGESIQIVHNEKTKASVLTGDAIFITEDRTVKADVIEHNGIDDSFSTRGEMRLVQDESILVAEKFYSKPESTVKIATGDVVWRDTVENIQVLSDSLFLDEENNSVLAKNEAFKPLLRNVSDGDTIWMSAIEVDAEEITDSTGLQKIFNATKDVKVLSSSFQATSEFLSYNTTDSLLSLTKNPIMWVDSTQFKADSIEITLVNDEPSMLFLNSNAIIIIESYPTVFDQIQGKEITVWLSNSKIDSMFVKGNAESVYFMKDEQDAYIGADKTACSAIMFYFEEEELTRIQHITKPTSTFVPMQGINLQELQLSAFGWYITQRPLVLNDLDVGLSDAFD